ncbi:hypothetical protein TNCV_4146181 [Trichonephila clavipes]|nr:hypothetical protein TNCV_4146181 [Trichonephila clavipes]
MIRRNPIKKIKNNKASLVPYRCPIGKMLYETTAVSQNPNVLKVNHGFTCVLQTLSDSNKLQSKNWTKIWIFDLNVYNSGRSKDVYSTTRNFPITSAAISIDL